MSLCAAPRKYFCGCKGNFIDKLLSNYLNIKDHDDQIGMNRENRGLFTLMQIQREGDGFNSAGGQGENSGPPHCLEIVVMSVSVLSPQAKTAAETCQ